MLSASSSTERPAVGIGRLVAGFLIFLVTLLGGLLYVKWLPYYTKSLVALTHHTIGASIVTGTRRLRPSDGARRGTMRSPITAPFGRRSHSR